MIKIDNVDVFGWESAIRGMRNPMNSWAKSDSYHLIHQIAGKDVFEEDKADGLVPPAAEYHPDAPTEGCEFIVGDADLKLMKTLSKAGSDHGKFLRMINVTLDINAPLYWWKEFDTYKVGTVANSCSTMHKIHSKEITKDDFSFDQRDEDVAKKCELYVDEFACYCSPEEIIVAICENLRLNYEKTKDKRYWRYLIQILPDSYDQKRTVQLNYQVLKSMYFARKNHKLDEWVEFCKWIETLPYFKEICLDA